MSAEMRLATAVWVAAYHRRCDRLGLPFTVIRRGDPDGGVVLLKIVGGDGAVLLSQASDETGRAGWRHPLGPEPIAEDEADAHIGRQVRFDSDLWAIEIIDRRGVFRPDEPILDRD